MNTRFARLLSCSRGIQRLFAVCVAVACGSANVYAQAAGPIWISLDTQPAGTQASTVLNRAASNEDVSVFNVTIHGFYAQSVPVSGQGTFIKIWLPGSPDSTLGTVGRPALPTHSFMITIPTDAPAATLTSVTPTATSTLPGYTGIYPAQHEEIESPGALPIPTFDYDGPFYATTAQFPTGNGSTGSPAKFDGLRFQRITVTPFKVIPSTGQLSIQRQFSVRVDHAGTALPSREITRRSNTAFSRVVENWSLAAVNLNLVEYHGCYLIVCPQSYLTQIEPLAEQKRRRGLRVTTVTLESLASPTATNIRNAILNWYSSCYSNGGDHYVLLVGDTNVLPMTTDPVYGAAGDHHYASTDGDVWPEMRIGRLSVNNGTDLTNQVTKILAYENSPPTTGFIEQVELAAHRQVENGYIQCMNDVADYDYYINPPTFTRRHGNSSTGTNANVISDINVGRGIVMYRGHGSSTSWSSWDFNSASLTSGSLTSMTNGTETPVVLGVACTNSNLTSSDCIAESWMTKYPGGAVAYYGATASTGTGRNHAFAKRFFNLLYGGNPPQISILTDFSWFMAGVDLGIDSTNENWVKYLVLGDPEMSVWKRTPGAWTLSGLQSFMTASNNTFTVTLRSLVGAPIPGKVVALHKLGEVIANGYSDANGRVTFTIPIGSAGQLSVRAFDDLDSGLSDIQAFVPVWCVADVDNGLGQGVRDGGVGIEDLLYYLLLYDRGDVRADVDDGSGQGVRDGGVGIEDLLYFLDRYDLGC
jgi:hypothetical protein